MSGPLVFFGTPEFAVPSLEALAAADLAPRLVVSQPARPAGRGRALLEPPVASRARELGLAVLQPHRLVEIREVLAGDPPQVAIVVAYGRIFPQWLLDLPAWGCVNLHASLLPRWRGAAPIQAAVAAGDRTTGVTTMRMEASLDTGPILMAEALEIGDDETAAALSARLAVRGAHLLVATLDRLAKGVLRPVPQPAEGVTYAPRVTRRDGDVDWKRPAREIYDRFRAFAGWPDTTTWLGGEALKIASCRPLPGEKARHAAPGEVVRVAPDAVVVACGEGTLLALERVQRPGRKELAIDVFLRGEPLRVGARFDAPPSTSGGSS